MYDRFKWNPEIRFESGVMADLNLIPDGSRIFWGSTIELFHEDIKDEWREAIFTHVKAYSEFTHIFLTKQPQNLIKWEFPENCWVGVTTTNPQAYHEAAVHLSQINAKVRFIRIEPLLHRFWINDNHPYIDWLIIGQQTPVSKKTEPKIEDIDEVEAAAKKAGIPYFEKDNLKSLLNRELVQEFPKVK